MPSLVAPLLLGCAHAAAYSFSVTVQPSVSTSRGHAVTMMAEKEEQLHRIARRATLRGEFDDAIQCYQHAIDSFGSSRSFLLAALLLTKVGLVEDARACFATGIYIHRDDAKLMQAWGLFESKHGLWRRSVRLLKRAVDLDPSLYKVLTWSRFREPPAPADMAPTRPPKTLPPFMYAGPPRRRLQLQPAVCMTAPSPQPPTRPPSPQPPTSTRPADITVQRPRVRYTVPQSALGWKGRPELGEDPTLWYDDEGERKGPPLNYWRQSMDERLHGRCFDAVDAVLESSSGSGVSLGEVDGEVDSEDGLRALEYRMSITRPMRNRKLLGRWAPIVVDGAVVAKAAEAAETSQSREYVAGQGPAYLVPEMWDIAREGGRKTVAHRYGEQDMHLEEGEIMRLTVSSSPEASDEQVLSATVEATASKERFTLDLAAEGEGSKATVYVGGVSFLNEYLLVARDAEGALSELFVRVDAP